jgi:hypothetical protein
LRAAPHDRAREPIVPAANRASSPSLRQRAVPRAPRHQSVTAWTAEACRGHPTSPCPSPRCLPGKGCGRRVPGQPVATAASAAGAGRATAACVPAGPVRAAPARRGL